MPFIILLIIAAIVLIVWIAARTKPSEPSEPPERTAGRLGEEYASGLIESVLRSGDRLFTNVTVTYDGRETELDNLVVNQNGVFIIEVKNYKGRLVGGEDDFEWDKYSVSGGGNTYVKKVKNPIKQVKRQEYLLAKCLESFGVRVWVEGYALILGEGNAIKSRYILSHVKMIDKALHTPGKNRLDRATVARIVNRLEG